MTLAAANPPTAAAQRIEELGRIILAYSEVTERLQESHNQLRGQVESLREELSEKNRLLERKNRLAALGEMAAGMAHEIRNPLGGIQLYASLLANDVADRPASRQICAKISAGVKHLEGLVSQVLNFSREVRAQPVQMDLAEVVENAVALAAAKAEVASVQLAVDGPAPAIVRADPLLIGQIILNLVLNAVEAMTTAGQVHIRYAVATDEHFVLSVTDQGPGIPADILERIFNPFFTTKDTGTGLGLSIVHRVVEAHDGTITASNVEGGGARFEIRI